MNIYLQHYRKNNRDSIFGVDAGDIVSQLGSQLATARQQRENALKILKDVIDQLKKVESEINQHEKNIRPKLQAAGFIVFVNKTKGRQKIEELIRPNKAKEAKRLRFVFPGVIGLVSLLAGSKFWKLNQAIKDSFDLSFDVMGYVSGAKNDILIPTIKSLELSYNALNQAKIPMTVSTKEQAQQIISKYEQATAIVDRELGKMQDILRLVKSDYVPKIGSIMSRSDSIWIKVTRPLEFIIKTLKEGPTSGEEAREQRQERRSGRRSSRQDRRSSRRTRRQQRRQRRRGSRSYFDVRDRQRILNKVRRSKRRQRARELASFYKPLKQYKNDAFKQVSKIKNDLPGQIQQGIQQIGNVRNILQQVNAQLQQVESLIRMMP